jgi:hypothetical protein
VKGKGVSFMENTADWHHKVPSRDQLARAMEELQALGVVTLDLGEEKRASAMEELGEDLENMDSLRQARKP